MRKFILGLITGAVAVLAGSYILCEVAEHCDLPLEVPEDA